MEHKFERYFSEEEWERFKYNIDNYGKIPLGEYLVIKFDDLEDFVLSSFSWIDSPERHDYWDKISQRTSPVR